MTLVEAEDGPENINPALLGMARPIQEFTFDPENARLHPERNIPAIMFSLEKFGQQKPIVCLEDGTVIAGNGMLQAAQALF